MILKCLTWPACSPIVLLALAQMMKTLATTQQTHNCQRPLRSRPGINFYASAMQYPSSHTTGSTLHSNPNFSMLLHKAACLALLLISPWPSIKTIASLSLSEIYHNPHYCNLCTKYDHLSDVFTMYLGKDLTEFCISQHNTHIPGALSVCAAIYYQTSIC